MSGQSYGIFVGRNNMPCFDVVTVTYQNADTIERFFKPWLANNYLPRLSVVDNGSQDGTVGYLQATLAASQYHLNPDNRGFALAANQAAAMGQHDFIAFINPDCFVSTETVQSLVDYLHNKPQVGLVGCRVLNEDGSLQAASCRQLPTFWRVFNHITGLHRLGFPGINKSARNALQSASVSAVNGAFFVIRRDLFKQLNGFDEAYPLHFEDLDLMKRSLDAGYQIHYLSELQAIHLQGHSTDDPEAVKQWKRQGFKRYFNKHRPAWEQWLVNLLLR